MPKPNFLVIGSPKSATTSLCYLLGQHPGVFMCKPKEPFFFCYDHIYKKGWNWYESLFKEAKGKKAIGEGSTPYSQSATFPNTVPRIVKHLSEAKIIYIVRHPLKRLESMWMELLSQGLTMLPFNEALRKDPQYIDSSLYWKQINAYRKYFLDNRILILFFEDFKKNPNKVLEKCFRFLGVNPKVHIPEANKPRYVSKGKHSDLKFTNFLRKNMPFFHKIRDIMPMKVRFLLSNILKKPIKERPKWDPKVRIWAINQIKNDIETFLKFYGKPKDFWKLD